MGHRSLYFVIAFSLAAVAGSDWPHVRGRAYDASSTETGLVESWPEGGPPLLWSRELGAGYSGFAVGGGWAFTLFQSNTAMFVIALDTESGAEIWRSRVDWPWQPGGMYPGPYASPTLHAGRVYYATPTGNVGCLSADDGHEVWTVNVRTKFRSRGTEFGFACPPFVEDGRVVLPVGGVDAAMVALSANDGSELWKAGDDPASYCPALPITLDGRRLLLGYLRNALVLHDPATGARVWQHHLSSNYDEHAACPLFDTRHLLIASPFKIGSQVFRLDAAGGGVTGTTVWAGKQLSNDVCSSLLINGSAYGFDLHQLQASPHRPSRGLFKCIELTTGKTQWETDRVGQATPIAADGKLVLWSETGTLILARASPAKYEELARAEILSDNGLCWAPPALSDKRLFVRNHERAACVYLGPPSDLDPARSLTVPPVRWRLDWSKLFPREPDYPNDAPPPAEVGRWFAACVALIFVARALTLVVGVVAPRWRTRSVFATTAFLLGLAGTTAIGAFADIFLLTWPVSLYMAFRGIVALGAGPASPGWRHQIAARLVLVLFGLMCYGYYLLCMEVGYPMAWGFLAGYLPAAPFLFAAAKARRPALSWAADMMGFTFYFWVSGLIPGWKGEWGS